MIDGLRRPSELKRGGFSILANGLLGLGSHGVPSTLAHLPTRLPRPTMLCSTKLWSEMQALESTIDSRTRTPGPITVPLPMLTFGPSCGVVKYILLKIPKVMRSFSNELHSPQQTDVQLHWGVCERRQ